MRVLFRRQHQNDLITENTHRWSKRTVAMFAEPPLFFPLVTTLLSTQHRSRVTKPKETPKGLGRSGEKTTHAAAIMKMKGPCQDQQLRFVNVILGARVPILTLEAELALCECGQTCPFLAPGKTQLLSCCLPAANMLVRSWRPRSPRGLRPSAYS